MPVFGRATPAEIEREVASIVGVSTRDTGPFKSIIYLFTMHCYVLAFSANSY